VKEASPRINFESLSALLAALTRKRLEVLDTVASHPGFPPAPWATLGRDYKKRTRGRECARRAGAYRA